MGADAFWWGGAAGSWLGAGARASISRLSQGQAYANKAAYQLLDHAQTTDLRVHACLALAALGGHLGRKKGGPIERQTRRLGRRSLRLLVEGVNTAAQLLDE